jgi:hypothetical protein
MYPSAIYELVKDTLVNSALRDLVSPVHINITVDDRPYPSVGQSFINIHPMMRYNVTADKDQISDRVYFAVTAGHRTRSTPQDRLNNKINEERDSLDTILECIVILLGSLSASNNNNILLYINNKINKYSTPVKTLLRQNDRNILGAFRYLDCDSLPTARYPEYFSSKDATDAGYDRPAGYTLTARFLAPYQAFPPKCR